MARKMQARIRIDGVEDMAAAIKDHDNRVKRMVAAEMLRAAPEAEAFAKRSAPWTDRSGNARAGLHAKPRSFDDGNVFELIVAHTVFYGIFLETRFSGKYAIIMPTVNEIGQQLMDRIQTNLGRLETMQ